VSLTRDTEKQVSDSLNKTFWREPETFRGRPESLVGRGAFCPIAFQCSARSNARLSSSTTSTLRCEDAAWNGMPSISAVP